MVRMMLLVMRVRLLLGSTTAKARASTACSGGGFELLTPLPQLSSLLFGRGQFRLQRGRFRSVIRVTCVEGLHELLQTHDNSLICGGLKLHSRQSSL